MKVLLIKTHHCWVGSWTHTRVRTSYVFQSQHSLCVYYLPAEIILASETWLGTVLKLLWWFQDARWSCKMITRVVSLFVDCSWSVKWGQALSVIWVFFWYPSLRPNPGVSLKWVLVLSVLTHGIIAYLDFSCIQYIVEKMRGLRHCSNGIVHIWHIYLIL